MKRGDHEWLIGDAVRHRWMNEECMARLRAEVLAERERTLGSSDDARAKLVTAIKRKDDQVSRIVNAISEAGHDAALLAQLSQLQAEARELETELRELGTGHQPSVSSGRGEGPRADLRHDREDHDRAP